MLNSCQWDIFKNINAAQLIGLPISVSHHFIRLPAAWHTVELQTNGRKITSDLSSADSICAAALNNCRMNSLTIVIDFRPDLSFLLLRAGFFAGVQPEGLRLARLFVHHSAPITFVHFLCKWLPFFAHRQACDAWFLHAGCVRSGWDYRWVNTWKIATDLHEGAWLTDKKAHCHPAFIATLAIMFRLQVFFFFPVTVSHRRCLIIGVSQLVPRAEALYWLHAHIFHAPLLSPPQRWPFRTLTWHFDKLVDGLFKQVGKFCLKCLKHVHQCQKCVRARTWLPVVSHQVCQFTGCLTG